MIHDNGFIVPRGSVSSLFQSYDLITRSGLFDAAHYLQQAGLSAQDVADPLLHYLESGAAAGLSPHPRFDVSFYLAQCAEHGEATDNPLLHFLTRGHGMGLQPQAEAAAPAAALEAFRVWIESPQLDGARAASPISGSLRVEGWAVAAEGITQIQVLLDGKPAGQVQHGFRRDDVADAIGPYPDALHSGFAVVLPARLLKKGAHQVALWLQDRQGRSSSLSFMVQVQGSAESGLGQLRLRMNAAERRLKREWLARRAQRPQLKVLIRGEAEQWREVESSLRSLCNQHYGAHTLAVLSNKAWPASAQRALRQALPADAPAIQFCSPRSTPWQPQRSQPKAWWLFVAPGDVFGCDALLELALAADPAQADLISYDERCRNAQTGECEAFYKPHFSPDLLRSWPYLGLAFLVHERLLQRAALNLREWLQQGDYHLSLRLAEQLRQPRHLPALLSEQGTKHRDRSIQQQQALRAHLQRQMPAARLAAKPGAAPWSLQPHTALPGKVSIIIATRASRGLIQTCLESIRRHSQGQDIEIICIENIPPEQAQWRQWLQANADQVISTQAAFNWSAYNNQAAARASGDYLLFLNDDIEVLHPGWLPQLMLYAARDDVGAVGALLLYPQGTVQHAGIALSAQCGIGRHSFRNAPADEPGYFHLQQSTRNVIAVTGACLMTRRTLFSAMGGFDERYTIVNNDVDYCLRCHDQGLRNVITPQARLIHHEMVSRGDLGDRFDRSDFERRWQTLYSQGDPYLNPALTRLHDDISPEREPVRRFHAARPLWERAEIQRIAVFKIDHIGDCVTALPALADLREAYPRAQITLISAPTARAIWQLSPAVDEIIDFAYFHERSGLGPRKLRASELQALREQLASRRFDLAIDLRKSPDTRELLQLSGARYLAGYDHQQRFPWLDVAFEWENDVRQKAKRESVGESLRHLVRAVAAAGGDAQPVLPRAPGKLPATVQRLLAQGAIAIHPSAGAQTRQWPLSHFAELIRALLQNTDRPLLLIGSPSEQPLVKALLAQLDASPRLINLCGTLPLPLLPALLQRCALFIGNNSGPHHLAAALGTPTLGIHSGVVDAQEWGPQGPRAVALQKQMHCAPCYLPTTQDCPRAMACLRELPVSQVLQQALLMLEAPQHPRARIAKT